MTFGLMQDVPLLISGLIEHAALNHGDTEIVARQVDGTIFRYTYAEAATRCRKLARALGRLGIGAGDVVATLAWNTHRHFECFYGISGIGAICHTVNPRLFEDQIRYIINHAGARLVLLDRDFAPLLAAMRDDLPALEAVILLDGKDDSPGDLGTVYGYEELLAAESDEFAWPRFDERCASSLCYTSGTTGHPKGVLYSHRSTVIHALAAVAPDNMNISAMEVVMPVAPLYHANGWALPYSAAMVGAKFVLPGRHLDPENLVELIRAEGVTLGCGVPTIWTMILEYLESEGGDLGNFRRTFVAGTAMPRAVRRRLKEGYNVTAQHLWGMTEMSPLGVTSTLTPKVAALSGEARETELLKQGRLPFGVEMKILLADGSEAPRDGETFGDIWVRGPWISSGYLKGDGGAMLEREGFFPTGDVGTIDEYGFMQITDRSKDVIKSGGEWISSVQIEDIVMDHPAVSLAAVIGVPHAKWDERPLLIVTTAGDVAPSSAELLAALEGRIAKWWIPDDAIVIDEMPLTATGKIRKNDLRARFRDHHLTGRPDG